MNLFFLMINRRIIAFFFSDPSTFPGAFALDRAAEIVFDQTMSFMTLGFFGGRNAEKEIFLLTGLLAIGLCLVLLLFGLAYYCLHDDRRRRRSHALPPLDPLEAKRRNPYLRQAFAGLAVLCGILFPFIALAAWVEFKHSALMVCMPFSIVVAGCSLYAYSKIS